MTAQEQAPARPGRVPPDWTGGRQVREAVAAATGDEDFAAWAAARWPCGDFSLTGAQEDYRRRTAEAEIRRDGIALSGKDMRILVSLLAKEGIRQSGSDEVVVRQCGKYLTGLAAQVKVLADGPGDGYRLTAGGT